MARKAGRFLPLLLLLLLLAACGATAATPSPPPAATAPLTLPAGYTADVVTGDLRGPTQMILGPDGRLWVAQLAGGESAGTGQVIALDLDSGASELLLDDLFKPTGIAVLGGALWIAAGRDILRAPLDADGRPAAPEVVLADLPFNGRSNGTLTPTPDGRLLFETSGRRQGNEAAPDSGILWQLDPADPTRPQALATGLKGAYAHAFDGDGRLWTTEIGDDRVNGQPPPDELNLVVAGADFGWPQCYGFREPAENYGGTAARCAETRPPVVLFEPQATPTGVVASPWEADTLLVALWTRGVVVRVPVTFAGDNATGTAEPFAGGLQNPQHLLVLPDQSLLLSDFSTGTLYRVTRPEAR